ncbi:MAG: sensor histidine kinase [Nocardioidaceae bacterium]
MALALDRAQAQEDRAALAILADRDRIARDLHDVVIQRLFATALTLQSAVRRVDGDATVTDKLTGAIADLDSTIRDIRGTIFELESGNESGNLRSQIRDVAVAAEPALGCRPHIVFDGPLDSLVPPSVRPHLLAVLVEALSNTARHADADSVEVTVRTDGAGMNGRLTAEVHDDGHGFTTVRRESGLRHMRERAASLGGEFAVESVPGHGTVVRWTVPLAPGVS